MPQMYKIFAHSKCIYFVSKNNFSTDDLEFSKSISYSSPKDLQKKMHQFFASADLKNLIVIFESVKKIETSISSIFDIIEAAGGLVTNNSNNLLMIFRNEKWDLPKGKVEKNEKIKDAALREVIEECGISDLKIGKRIETTHHLYTLHERLILKKTHWFEMKSEDEKKLKPQLEEGITKAKWMDKAAIKKAMKNTYPLIEELLNQHL